MAIPKLSPWLGAIVCGAMLQSPVDAGGWFGMFSKKKCDPCEAQCQQCPPKKQKFKCFHPPEPPRAPIGMSFAADPQAQFADPQDDRMDKLEKDVTRLTLIVKQLVDNPSAAPQAAPAPRPAEAPAPAADPSLRAGEGDPVPPGPIPASAQAPATQKRATHIQQAIIQRPDPAVVR